MKLKYETRTKAIHEAPGKAGYGGWTTYTTSAKTVNGLRKRMREEAQKEWERREAFYAKYEVAHKFDIYDEDHVWHFHTYAPLDARTVMRYELYAVKRDGMPTQFIEAVYDGKNWDAYRTQVERVESMCA